MTKLFKNKIAIVLCCVLLLACCLVCAQFVAPTALADTPSGTTTPSVTPPTYNPTVSFSVLDGVNDSDSTEVYGNLFDCSINTKYCVKIEPTPYVVFKSSSYGTKISGYKFFTANDTASHEGRNPKSWILYGSNDYDESAKTGTWTAIHTVTDDNTMGATNRTGYSFTVSNAGVYKYFKFEFTARRGAESDDQGTWTDTNIQLSEIEMQATVDTSQTTLASNWRTIASWQASWHDDNVTTYDGSRVSINAHINNETNSQKALIYGVAVYTEQALSDSQINQIVSTFSMTGSVVGGSDVAFHEGVVNVIVSADKKCVALQTDNTQFISSCNVSFKDSSNLPLFANDINLTELAFLYRYQCEHKFTDSYPERVESTCALQGARKYRTCANGCGACQYYDDVGDLQTCEVNEFRTKVMLPLAQHTWSTTEVIAEQPATCTATGTVAHWHCSACGKDFDSTKATELTSLTTEKISHNFGDWHDEVPASCTETGTKGYKTCSICNLNYDNSDAKIDSLTIPANGHTYGAWTAYSAATCTAQGNYAYRQCSVCNGYQYITDTSVLDLPGYISTGGAMVETCTQVQFETNVKLATVSHTYDSWMAYSAPTCTAGGVYANRQCSVCRGYQYITDTSITDYDAYVAADSHPALQTCTSGESERVELAPSNHTYGTWTARKAVSCEEDGNHAYRQCSVCNKYQYITDPLVVDYDSHVNGVGTDVYTCIQSEFNTKIKFAATGHSYTISTWIPAEPNTCTTAGNYAYHQCDNCAGFQYIDDLSVTTVALCEQFAANAANSAHVLFVEEASFESTVKLAALGHNYGAWVPAVAKGCLTDGNLEYRQCSNCNNYQYVPTGSTQAQAEECASDEFDSYIKLENYGGHDTLVTYKEVVNGVHYHGNKCQREGCGAWDGAPVACEVEWVCNGYNHWSICSVCEHELSERTAHTFESDSSTYCEFDDCPYGRFFDITFTVNNYEIDGLINDIELVLSCSNTNVKFTEVSTKIYMDGIDEPIGETDTTATILRHQTYRIEFTYSTAQFELWGFSWDDVTLPDGAELDSMMCPRDYTTFTIQSTLYLPALAGKTETTTVPDVEIEFGNWVAGATMSQTTCTIPDDLQLDEIWVSQKNKLLSEQSVISGDSPLDVSMRIVAPQKRNFFGYTIDDVTIANDVGRVCDMWVSSYGNVLELNIIVYGNVSSHECTFVADDLSNNPDPTRYHGMQCTVCNKIAFVEHVYDGILDNSCDVCGFDERVVAPDRLDITFTGYAIDAKISDIAVAIGENDYGICLNTLGVNNGYSILYTDQYSFQQEIDSQFARFYPGVKYYLQLDLKAPAPTDIGVVLDNLYINGVKTLPKFATISSNGDTSVLVELTPLVGTTTQQKVTNFTIECLDVPTNGQTFHVAATETDEYLSIPVNAGVLAAVGYVSTSERSYMDSVDLVLGNQYYVNVILVLADGYHYNGMDISDVTLTAEFQHGGSFQTVEVVRAGYKYFSGTQYCCVEYKFLIQMDHEEAEHVCFEQTIGFEGTPNGHYAVCKCGAMSTALEQHVYESEYSEQCTICGYCRKVPITELALRLYYDIGADYNWVPNWVEMGSEFGRVVYARMYKDFDWETGVSTAVSVVQANQSHIASITILLDNKFDLSTLTTQTVVAQDVGSEDIHASIVDCFSQESGSWVVSIMFELPPLMMNHLHGGEWTDGTPATCTETGLKGYYTCTYCGKRALDGLTLVESEDDRTIEPLGHDWTLMFCEDAVEEGNFHDYYCLTCHAWKGERQECDINTDWQRDDNNHWRICEDCGHRHFLGTHTQTIVCNDKQHWTACPVCDKEFDVHVNHVFENEQSTTCSTEGCLYHRYTEVEIEVENYVLDGLMTSLDATATNKTDNKDMPLVRAYFLDEELKLIGTWRDEGGLEFGATFQPETIYLVEFIFRCDNYFLDTSNRFASVKLPDGFTIVEAGHEYMRDDPDKPRYNVLYVFAVMPLIGGVSQLEKVPDLQLEVSNFAADQFVGDIEIAANANAEVVKHEVLRGGLVIPFDMKLNNNGFYTLKVTLSAPVGYTFRGYTVSDVTVKNNFGEVVGVSVSDSGSLLVVTIETRPTIGEHTCSEHLVCISPDRDSIVSPDAENKHRRYCEICGEYTYEAHVYDDKLDQTCDLCGYKRYYKLERLDIIVENYVLDGNVDQIKIKIAQNDYSIQVVGTFNNSYHVLDGNDNFYFGDYSRFLPDEQYTIRFDVTANDIVSFENVLESNVYVNGQAATVKYAYVYTNKKLAIYEVLLPKLTGTTTQQKATDINFTVTGATLDGNMCDFILHNSTENTSVVAVARYFYRVNGSTMTQVAADVGKFEAGYQYYVELKIKLADGYYAKGMGEGDVKVDNFPLVGEVTYCDSVLGASISPGAATIVTYTFKILFPQGEEHVHAFTGENLSYDITSAGHAVICDCGVLGTRVAHVPSETNEDVCSVCGGEIVEVLDKLVFVLEGYQIGAFLQYPGVTATSNLVNINAGIYCDEYDFDKFDFNISTVIVMPDTRYALVLMCIVSSDVTGLTQKDMILKGVGEADITACYIQVSKNASTCSVLIGFELPEPPSGNSHIHGGLWVDEVPASCTENGTKGYYECTICHEKFDDENNAIEDLVIPALGHKWSTAEIVAEVPASCTEAGTKAYWHCETCNTNFAADKTTVLTDLTIAALGHKWSTSEIVSEVPAKCAETGTKAHWHCETCNTDFAADKTTVLTDLTIAALGHKWSTTEIIAEVPAKCGIAGTKAHWHCETCNTNFAADKTTVLTDLAIEALVHNFGEWIVEVPATAEKAGTVAHKDCTLCGRHFDSDGVEIADISIPKLAGYLITFKIDGEVISEQRIATGEKVTYPTGGEKLGFTFSWSKTIQTMPAEDVVVEGVFAVDVNYFKGKVDAVANANSVEAKFQAIVAANKALALYNDTEKQVLSSEVSRLNTLVSEYKQAISSANADLNNAASVVDVLLGAFVQVALAAVAAVVIKRRLF